MRGRLTRCRRFKAAGQSIESTAMNTTAQKSTATQLVNTLAGKFRVEFPVPYPTPNGTLTGLTFRRGKVRDQLEAQRLAPGDSVRQELHLMTLLADETITIEDLEELDLADMAEVQRTFYQLLRQRGRQDDAPGAQPAGEVVSHAAVGDPGARADRVHRVGG